MALQGVPESFKDPPFPRVFSVTLSAPALDAAPLTGAEQGDKMVADSACLPAQKHWLRRADNSRVSLTPTCTAEDTLLGPREGWREKLV